MIVRSVLFASGEPQTPSRVHHKAIVEMAWISFVKLFVNFRERCFYSLEFQNYSSVDWIILIEVERGLIICWLSVAYLRHGNGQNTPPHRTRH